MDKNITCTYEDDVVQMTFYASESHIWAFHMHAVFHAGGS